MSATQFNHRTRDQGLLWGLLLSLIVHGLLAAQINPFSFDQSTPVELKVELLPPEPPPPPPEPEPEPPKPEPPKPEPPKPEPKPLPKKPLPEPLPVKATEPLPVALPVEPPPPPPEVIAVAPKAEEPPAFVAPPPPPEPPKPGPTQQDIDAARRLYGSQLAREFAKHKQYPGVARTRGWQGTTRVQLEIDTVGKVIATSISESSGYDVLDRQALEMVKKASPLPLPPEVLRERAFTILVPVVFRIE